MKNIVPFPVATYIDSNPNRREMKMQKKLQGIIVPLITPLETPETIDRAGTERMVRRVIEGGVNALFLLGSTGEGPALTARARCEFIDVAVAAAGGALPVLVGISGASGAEAVEAGKFAAREGVSAVVAAPPCYLPATEAELVCYYERLAGEVGLPVYLYNMPALTSVNISPELAAKLADRENIAGYKDSSGGLAAFRRAVKLLGGRPDFSLLIGPEHLTLPALQMGGDGGVNGGANLCPELFAALFRAVREGAPQERLSAIQREIVRLGELYGSLPGAPGVIRGLKYELARLGVIRNVLAFPALPLQNDPRSGRPGC